MELKSKLFAILAIFCVICSACAVSATDGMSDQGSDFYLTESQNVDDGTVLPPDYAHDEQHAAGGDVYDDGVPYHDDGTNPTANATGNATANVVGNATGNATGHAAGGNVSGNATNATNATATHTMPATGNPVLALMAVCALLGGYTVLRRK